MKTKMKDILFYAVVAAIIGYALWPAPQYYKENVTARQGLELQRSGAIILDVRTPEEWRQTGMVPGSVPATLDRNFLATVQRRIPDKNTPVVTLCRSGSRSVKAANILAEHGYSNVYNAAGGIGSWPKSPSPVSAP